MLRAADFLPLYSAPTTRSVRALSLLCEADRTANQLIYPEDFVLKFTQLGYLESERGATSMIMTPMMATNVLRARLAPLPSSLALIWSAERDGVAEERYYDDDETACHLYAEISTSCTAGERAASKVALETSLSVTVTMVLLLSGSFKSRLLNVKVTSVTPRSNLVIVTKR